MARRAHKPDPNQRRQVEAMAAYGIPAAGYRAHAQDRCQDPSQALPG